MGTRIRNYAFKTHILGLTNNKNYPNQKNITSLNRNLIGENIRIIRKEFNLSLRKLARYLDTTSSTISAYETGKTLILTAFAYQICKKYKVSLDYLVGRTNNSKIAK